MKHILPTILLTLLLISFCSPAYAQSQSESYTTDEIAQILDNPFAVAGEPPQTEEDILPSNTLNSLTVSAGAMGYVYFGGGPVVDLTYLRQTSNNVRQGASLRFFHDTIHNDHYISYLDDSGYKYTQIQMISAAYQLQGFKRKGNWEFGISGGFGLGFTYSWNYSPKPKPVYSGEYNPNDTLEGGMDLTWLLYGFYGDNWDFFFDISTTGTIEYYIGDYFSLGLNASIHYHTILYADISASVQFKILF